MSYTAEQFLKIIKPYVIADMENSGILASLTAAQALIESNKGNSGLTQKANNLFGIKGSYNGTSVTMNTKEFVNGRYITVPAQFRKYPSWAESIADHSAMFNRMARYSNLRGLKDYKIACKYVREDGYATSPTYTETLIKTIETYHLYEWDGVKAENPYPEPHVIVKLGMTGDCVKWLQWELNHKGAILKMDGVFGEKTLQAVLDFQNSYFVDGKVGTLTRGALKNR